MFLGNILKMIYSKTESKTRFVNRNIYIYIWLHLILNNRNN